MTDLRSLMNSLQPRSRFVATKLQPSLAHSLFPATISALTHFALLRHSSATIAVVGRALTARVSGSLRTKRIEAAFERL